MLPSSAKSLLTSRRWSSSSVGGAGGSSGGDRRKQGVENWRKLVSLVTVHAWSFPTNMDRFEDLPLLLPGFLVKYRHSFPVYFMACVYYVLRYS